MAGTNGGPDASKLIAMASAAGNDQGFGEAMGQDLGARRMANQMMYAPPSVPGPERAGDGDANNPFGGSGIPQEYNAYGSAPVRYAGPTPQKDRLVARQEIRDAINRKGAQDLREGQNPTVQRTDPITEAEVDYLQSMQDQIELADFDRWVSLKFNPRQPGQMKMLLDVYPEFVTRRLQQAKTDYDFSLRAQMISQWGINTFDDMHFQYMLDQGMIDGPRLAKRRDIGSQYADGMLSPYKFLHVQGDAKLNAPFAGAVTGANAGDRLSNWALDNGAGTAMSTRRTPTQLANAIYNPGPEGPSRASMISADGAYRNGARVAT